LSRTPYAALNRRVGTVFLQENPLVCTEKIHMLQDGLGVFVATSEDLICGGRPTSTTTSTSPPVMMPKLVPKRPSAFDTRPSGAFQAIGPLLQEREIPSEISLRNLSFLLQSSPNDLHSGTMNTAVLGVQGR
ncbi:hypothetical protein GCK32_018255, partial [Trichostrongylus colubriformis]